MTTPIVECIANYSEGRRLAVIEAIAKSVQDVSGVGVLDRHIDPDHNRCVITFAGSPEGVEEAAFQSIAKASQLIDLDLHRGEHPRIGAADVVPFVPISGISMSECVEIAKRLGERVGQALNIPVFLYEEAAVTPGRKNLEDIRRGEYETLKETIQTDPERMPDYGPAQLGPAGATVIGARHPLIAFNVFLTTDNLSIARQIARAVRHSSGGLRYVKALGMLVDGLAQVSMNLTNYRRTPVERVVEMIRTEARQRGTAIHHAELVGLIPQEALTQAALWYLHLNPFREEQILERKLDTLRLDQSTNQAVIDVDYLSGLAAGTAVPGGGSAAAYTGAQAAALTAMVARLTIGRKNYAEYEAEMLSVIAQADRLRDALANAAAADGEVYSRVMQAYKLPKFTPQEQKSRQDEIKRTILGALRIQLEVAANVLRVFAILEPTIKHSNIHAVSDGGTAAALARAALTSAAINVRVNAAEIDGSTDVRTALTQLSQIEQQAEKHEASIRQSLQDRIGIRC